MSDDKILFLNAMGRAVHDNDLVAVNAILETNPPEYNGMFDVLEDVIEARQLASHIWNPPLVDALCSHIPLSMALPVLRNFLNKAADINDVVLVRHVVASRSKEFWQQDGERINETMRRVIHQDAIDNDILDVVAAVSPQQQLDEALTRAAMNDKQTAAKILLNHGANPVSKIYSLHGRQALEMAAVQQHSGMVELLAARIDPSTIGELIASTTQSHEWDNDEKVGGRRQQMAMAQDMLLAHIPAETALFLLKIGAVLLDDDDGAFGACHFKRFHLIHVFTQTGWCLAKTDENVCVSFLQTDARIWART